MTVNFEDIKRFDVPVVFIEGRFDEHVSSKLAEDYFNTIETEKEFYWFEQSCHFPQWSKAERFGEILREPLINCAIAAAQLESKRILIVFPRFTAQITINRSK